MEGAKAAREEADGRVKKAIDRAKDAEDQLKETEDRLKKTEERLKEAEDRTKEAEDQAKKAKADGKAWVRAARDDGDARVKEYIRKSTLEIDATKQKLEGSQAKYERICADRDRLVSNQPDRDLLYFWRGKYFGMIDTIKKNSGLEIDFSHIPDGLPPEVTNPDGDLPPGGTEHVDLGDDDLGGDDSDESLPN